MTKDLGFCQVQFYDNYIICKVREGITFTVEEGQKLVHNAPDHFYNKPFVYISHRVNSYAVDPAVYDFVSQIENLIGFAVVSTNYLTSRSAEIEKMFFKKPFKIFDDLETATKWANTVLSKSAESK